MSPRIMPEVHARLRAPAGEKGAEMVASATGHRKLEFAARRPVANQQLARAAAEVGVTAVPCRASIVDHGAKP